MKTSITIPTLDWFRALGLCNATYTS